MSRKISEDKQTCHEFRCQNSLWQLLHWPASTVPTAPRHNSEDTLDQGPFNRMYVGIPSHLTPGMFNFPLYRKSQCFTEDRDPLYSQAESFGSVIPNLIAHVFSSRHLGSGTGNVRTLTTK